MRPLEGLLLICLAGCAGPSIRMAQMPKPPPVRPPLVASNYEVSTADDPAAASFEVRFANKSGEAVCLDRHSWPNEWGRLDGGSNVAIVHVDDQVYPMVDENGGYCPGCVVRIEAGSNLGARIPYRLFRLPEALYSKAKTLEFKPYPIRCD